MTLALTDTDAFYGSVQVLRSVSVAVAAGELVALIGANGAGKSTLLRSIAGLQRQHTGTLLMDGEPVTGLAAPVLAGRGLSLVPEGRQLFTELTVAENLIMGLHGRVRRADSAERQRRLTMAHDLFPILAEFSSRRAGLLSGGQQQMLAIARALVREPRYLLLDEPSLGLAPLLVTEILTTVRSLTDSGVGVLLAEQNAYAALRVADRGVVLENGRVTRDAPARELLEDPDVVEHYLGGSGGDPVHVSQGRPLPAELAERQLG